MTSAEFSLHQAYWSVEPSGPHGEVARWAALVAAVVNGPRVRRGSNKPFGAADIFDPDKAWAPDPADAAPPPGAKPARLAPDLSHMRGMTVRSRRRR